MAVTALDADLDKLLCAATIDGTHSAVPHLSNVRLLQHFQGMTSLTIGAPGLQSLMRSYVTQTAMQHPHLMHAILAVSSAHLRRLPSSTVPELTDPKLATVESLHWQQALRLYRKDIEVRTTWSDVPLATTFLTVVFLFALDDGMPMKASEDGLDDVIQPIMSTIAACYGFRALMVAFGPMNKDSIYLPVLTASDYANGTFTSDEAGISGLPLAVVELCGLDENSTPENHPYHKLVRLLSPLLSIEPNVHNFGFFLAFGGRAWPILKHLLPSRDIKALLIVSYWFAMLHSIDQWWIRRRAQTACEAIVAYLELQAELPSFRRLLTFPASLGKEGADEIWRPSDPL